MGGLVQAQITQKKVLKELELTHHLTYHMWLLLVVYHMIMTL